MLSKDAKLFSASVLSASKLTSSSLDPLGKGPACFDNISITFISSKGDNVFILVTISFLSTICALMMCFLMCLPSICVTLQLAHRFVC